MRFHLFVRLFQGVDLPLVCFDEGYQAAIRIETCCAPDDVGDSFGCIMHLLKTIPFRLFLFVSVRGNHIVSARISPFKGRSWSSDLMMLVTLSGVSCIC